MRIFPLNPCSQAKSPPFHYPARHDHTHPTSFGITGWPLNFSPWIVILIRDGSNHRRNRGVSRVTNIRGLRKYWFSYNSKDLHIFRSHSYASNNQQRWDKTFDFMYQFFNISFFQSGVIKKENIYS